MPGKKSSLKEYERKRNFENTAEPKGGEASATGGNMFVIQKHDASRLHYDLRLEIDGVLKSWAVPKGPSLDWHERRLAVHVEDHPIEYAEFEGTIPKNEYGGGTVMLWDKGTFSVEGDPLSELESGTMKIEFRGERMRGWWALVRMKRRGEEDKDNWLLIKEKFDADFEEGDEDLTEVYTTSVATGRSMEEIAKGSSAVWHSNRESSGASERVLPDEDEAARLTESKKKALPKFLKPMLCTWVQDAPTSDEWLHEIKFDGYRILARIEGGKVTLLTRNDIDWTTKFGAVAKQVADLGIESGMLDGEIVVLDENGISDFGALQNHLKGVKKGTLVYFVFDIPFYLGYDLTQSPLVERKELLREVLAGQEVVRFSDHIRGHGAEFFEQCCQTGLEGIISKKADSTYSSRRGMNWVKVKCNQRQEFVIGGYTEPSGSRHGFGALVVGYYNPEGDLIYCGRVGTGFDQKTLDSIFKELKSRERKTAPFKNPPTGAEKKGVHYVTPDLVCEIEYLAWTHEDRLRHPSFKGLRKDKDARQVVRERPVTTVELEDAVEIEEPVTKEVKSKKPKTSEADPPKSKESNRDGESVLGIKISNPGRVIFGDSDITKIELAEYMAECADWILPHVANRPLALVRCPQCATHECFFQKNFTHALPAALHSVDLGDAEGIGLRDAEGLVALAQFGVIEIHPWGSLESDVEHPDRITFDLDPGPELGWPDVVRGATDVRDLLAQLGLTSWVKTSGGKGLHVCVPLDPVLDWDTVKSFCRGVAEILEKQYPDRYVSDMSKAKRKGRIFVDYLRNGRGATSVAAYSARARDRGPVSVPVHWDEINDLEGANTYTVRTIQKRLASLKQDPWHDFADSPQDLEKVVKALNS